MKRYIRTKDGKIFDTKTCSIEELDKIILDKTIFKTADTIEELIEVGDLVGIFNGNVEKVNKTDFLDIRQEYQFYTNGSHYYWTDSDIIELYTKQDNDYILVARKENDGEWRVI